MARAYGDDLRRKVLGAYASGAGTLEQLAARFDVSFGWVKKIRRAELSTGSRSGTPQRRRSSQVDGKLLRELVRQKPDIVLRELEEAMRGHGHAVSKPQLWRVLKKLGLRLKKKSLHATERDTEENRRRREAFVETIRTVAPEDLIYLDESGVSTQMTRLYGRAEGGQRVHDAVPGGHWKMLTMVGAMDHNGMLAAMTVEAATDREVFLAYLDHVLCPKLRKGHVVVMDNLSAHKVDGVRQRIEACGASLLYLPPYSPDLNPIEKAWSKLKTGLRATGTRTIQALEQAVENLLPSITAQDAQAWFHLRY